MKSLAILIAAVALAGCTATPNPTADYGQKPDSEASKQYTTQILKDTLKDPDSLKNESHSFHKCYLVNAFGTLSPFSETYCTVIDYQATNSYGAYVRGSALFYISKSGYVYHADGAGWIGYDNEYHQIKFVK